MTTDATQRFMDAYHTGRPIESLSPTEGASVAAWLSQRVSAGNMSASAAALAAQAARKATRWAP